MIVWKELVTLLVQLIYFRKKTKDHEKHFDENFCDVIKKMPSHACNFIRVWPSVFLPYAAEDINTV